MSALKNLVAIEQYNLAEILISFGTWMSQKVVQFWGGRVVTCVVLTWNDRLFTFFAPNNLPNNFKNYARALNHHVYFVDSIGSWLYRLIYKAEWTDLSTV
jgi:hypothetical protein